jgi:hypothetical protein
MEIQVEIQFTIQHTLEELREAFVKRGHIPDWHVIEGVETRPPLYFEKRVVAMNLSTEADRFMWFVFCIEACGELRERIVIDNVIPSGVRIEYPDLASFLDFCRHCLVSTPGD